MKNTETYKEGTLGRMLVPHYLDVKLFLIISSEKYLCIQIFASEYFLKIGSKKGQFQVKGCELL